MDPLKPEVAAALRTLIDEYRARCLWYLAPRRPRGLSTRVRDPAMALTEFQRGVCRLLAENRIRSGESYVAGFRILRAR